MSGTESGRLGPFGETAADGERVRAFLPLPLPAVAMPVLAFERGRPSGWLRRNAK